MHKHLNKCCITSVDTVFYFCSGPAADVNTTWDTDQHVIDSGSNLSHWRCCPTGCVPTLLSPSRQSSFHRTTDKTSSHVSGQQRTCGGWTQEQDPVPQKASKTCQSNRQCVRELFTMNVSLQGPSTEMQCNVVNCLHPYGQICSTGQRE